MRIWVNTLFIRTPNDRNREICQRTKITRVACRRRIGGVVPRAEFCGDLITADDKVLSEGCESRNNHRYAVVVQDLATHCIQAYPSKNKTSQETQRSLQKFLEPDRNPKVIYTDNSLEFGRACEDLSWNHCTSTSHRSETTGIAERAARRVKEGTSAILLQSGLDANWWADSMECYTYLRNIQDLLSDGKTPYERRFGKTIGKNDHSVWFVGWILPYLCKKPVNNPSIWKESLTWIVPWIRIVCGWNLEGWHIGCRHWGVGNDGRIGNLFKKKLNAKEVIFPKQNEKFIFPAADGRIKFGGGDQELRTSTSIWDRPIRGEGHVEFLGESEGFLQQPHDSFPDAGGAINDFWSMSGSFTYRHHV